MTFAEAHRTIAEMLSKIRRSQDMGQLLEVFFGRQLDDLHGAQE